MANGSGFFTLRDYSGESATMGFNTGVITAGNLAGVLTQFGALRTAIAAISLCEVAKEGLSVFRTNLSYTNPTDPNAQRERKWLVEYRDATEYFDAPTNSIPNEGFGKPFNVEIPGADLDLTDVLLPGTDIVDLTQTQIAAFVTAFEALVKSPHGGAVEVFRITHIGKNT